MPTNLPPDYFEIEKRYRAAQSIPEKIELIEEMLSVVPKHKGTDHLRADLRRRLSKLKSRPQARQSTSRRDSAFHIDKEGAGQVAVVGPANVGKSALVAELTKATPQVSPAPHTTWQPTPGMMYYEDVQIQLIDTPSLDRAFVEPALIEMIRRTSLILLVIDLQAYPLDQLESSLALLDDNRILPLSKKAQAIDRPRLTFIPFQVLVNKNDNDQTNEDYTVLCELLAGEPPAGEPPADEWPLLAVSINTGLNLDRLRALLFERLEIIRIYSKPPGEKPDLTAPFVMPKGSTLLEFAGGVHHDFSERLKSARLWGTGAYDGQMVGRDHVLHDGDIVELRL
jgi:ribosome-interacting GTPase 1